MLLKWQETTSDTVNGPLTKRALVAIDEFRSFVRPTWRPQLHPFCTQLTGITQVRFHFSFQTGFSRKGQRQRSGVASFDSWNSQLIYNLYAGSGRRGTNIPRCNARLRTVAHET